MQPVSLGFLTPPTVFILVCLGGALLATVRRMAGIAVILVASLCLYLAAIPAFSSLLLRQVEARLPANPDLSAAQAIVVLGGSTRRGNGADIPDRLGAASLERVAFAAEAYRRLHLPVAVSGGRVNTATSEAELMKTALEQDFSVPVRWVEDRSRTTFENARNTAGLLAPDRVGTVIVVSQTWHLPRALWAFERVGLHALPWSAPRTALRIDRIDDFLPTTGALNDSFHALHELIGAAYYRLRYG